MEEEEGELEDGALVEALIRAMAVRGQKIFRGCTENQRARCPRGQ
jgi:hypothetical protein